MSRTYRRRPYTMDWEERGDKRFTEKNQRDNSCPSNCICKYHWGEDAKTDRHTWRYKMERWG